MPRTALVTGSAAAVGDVGDALERVGFVVVRSSGSGGLNGECSSIAPRSLGCYVQLPGDAEVGGLDQLGRLRRFLADGLLARFDAAYAVAPLLRPDACVVLVAGSMSGETAPDELHAQRELLQVLARAISCASVEGDVKAVVAGADHSPQEIAQIAARRGEDRAWLQSRVAALSPDLSYADWKRELLGLI